MICLIYNTTVDSVEGRTWYKSALGRFAPSALPHYNIPVLVQVVASKVEHSVHCSIQAYGMIFEGTSRVLAMHAR